MSVIADVTVAAADFPFWQALQVDPNLQIRLERVIPLGQSMIPYLWVSDDSIDRIRAGIEADPNVDAFDIVDEIDSEALVRVEWHTPADGVLRHLAATDGVILDGVGEGHSWEFQLRFPAHEDLSAFFRRCTDEDISMTIQRVHNPGVPREPGMDVSLTDAQRETLLTALDAGYFDVPRTINLIELGEQMGISDTAASQRLRRGLATLVAATLTPTTQPDASERGEGAEK